jgi:polyketide synthase Type III
MSNGYARILRVSTAVPEKRYAQRDLLANLGVPPIVARALLRSSGIETRYICSPLDVHVAEIAADSHRLCAVKLCGDALRLALAEADCHVDNVAFLCCVTSTGLLLPSLSALVIKDIGLRADCQRVDIVGMGCSAGVNGLNVVANWQRRRDADVGILVCCEVNSALYSPGGSMEEWIVNSLFGDGAAAVVLGKEQEFGVAGAAILDFESRIVTEHSNLLRFEVDKWNRVRFILSRRIAKVLQPNLADPIEALLQRNGLSAKDVRHWILHGGGPAIVDAFENALILRKEDLHNTTSVLRQFGNISSASVFFAYCNVINSGDVKQGDYGVIVGVGPGLAIEAALIQW